MGIKMKRESQGYYVTTAAAGESVRAFVPAYLPPVPPIQLTPAQNDLFSRALLALGRLDGIVSQLPDTTMLLYSYVRKEAVLSSMIEGTQSSLSDLMLFEIEQQPGVPFDDVNEVSNYVAAMSHGISRLAQGFPISTRLLREIHAVLLSHGRGSCKQSGEFRTSQNWIGGTRPGNAIFVPPPVHYVHECMGALELFLHNKPEPYPALIKAALAHVQFETIHPFLDGNGRLGRLLITLLLYSEGVLKQPLLYLSLFFKTYRETYYERLNRVRLYGEWEEWLEFFAEAVLTTAEQAIATTLKVKELILQDHGKITEQGRAASSLLQLHQALCSRPITTSGYLAQQTGITAMTVNKGLAHLSNLGITKELTGQKRNRIYSYQRYIQILNEGI